MESDDSPKISELEILSYENAETWFTKVRAILKGKDVWTPIQDIIDIRQGRDPQLDSDDDDDSLLSPRISTHKITKSRATATPAVREDSPTPSIETSNLDEERARVRKLLKKSGWKKNNRLAIANLLRRLSSTDVNVIKDYRFAGDIWLHLKETYEQRDRILMVKAFEQLLSWSMKPDQRILAAVNEIRHLAARIPEFGGESPSETIMIVVLLKGLPEEYKTFQQTLLLRDLSFNQIVESLKTAESTLPTSAINRPKLEFANRAVNKKVRCYECGKLGHYAKNCPEKSDQEKDTSRSKKIKQLRKEKARIAAEIAELNDSESDESVN
jgi:hypothetical protein